MRFGTLVIVMSNDRRKRECYLEHDDVRIDFPIDSAVRRLDASGTDETTIVVTPGYVQWEERQ